MPRFTLRFLVAFAILAGALGATLGTGGTSATASAGPNVTLADTSYAVPSGATFVSTSGSDTAAGSQAAPWRTIQKAINATPSGGTVVIRGGTYREGLQLSNKSLTLQPYPHEQVWVKASVVVTGWVSDGSAWRKDGWTPTFTNVTTPSGYIDANYPMAGYPDMIFVDGQPLTQVGSRSAVTAGTFYVDPSHQQLFVGSDPNGHQVEGAAYKNALMVYNAPNSKILGLGFMHAASTANSASGAVILDTSPGVLVENNTFAWNAASGFQVGQASHDVVVRNNQMLYNGLVGADTWGGPQRLRFTNNYLAYNNQERFSVYWAAAGLKLNKVFDSTVADNIVENNTGSGIWCDNSCGGVRIVRNLVRNNSYQGIMYEISDGGIIASNLIANNAAAGGGGVYVSASTNVQVYNNTVVSSSVANARSVDVNSDSRKTTGGVVIKNNIFSHANSSGLWTVRVQDDGTNTLAAGAMVSAMDANAYYRKTTSSPPTEVRWGKAGGYNDYSTLGQFRTATSAEANGIAVDAQSTNPFFVNEGAGDYHLKSGSPALGHGSPLPADVASAIGVSPGTAVDMGVLVWPPTSLAPPTTTTTAAPPSTTTTAPPSTTTTAPPSTTTTAPSASADNAGPGVTISSPTDGSAVGKKTTNVAASASGNIKTMKLVIDGAQVASSSSSTLKYSWNTRSLAAGDHRVSVTATAVDGSSSTATVTVHK